MTGKSSDRLRRLISYDAPGLYRLGVLILALKTWSLGQVIVQ